MIIIDTFVNTESARRSRENINRMRGKEYPHRHVGKSSQIFYFNECHPKISGWPNYLNEDNWDGLTDNIEKLMEELR